MKIITKREENSKVANGLALMVPFNIRIDRYFSDEEKAANAATANELLKISNDAYNAHCEEIRKTIAAKVDKLLVVVEENFTIGQLHDDGGRYPNYDLWFWCNCGDHSYVTLNFLPHYRGADTEKLAEDAKRIEALYLKAAEILESYDEPNLSATFWFHTVDLPQEIEKKAKEKSVELAAAKWVKLDGMIGKFTINEDGGYCFRKKNARKYYYRVDPDAVLRCEVA